MADGIDDWSDDFNDNNYDGWTVSYGAFSVPGYLIGTQSGFNEIYRNNSVAYGIYRFDLWENHTAQKDRHIYFISNDWDKNSTNGYSISFEYGATSNFTLYKWNGLIASVLDRATIPIEVPGWHSYNITRTPDGVFQIERNSTSLLSATDNSTTTSSYYIYSIVGEGGIIDNITVTGYVSPTTVPSTPTTTTTPSTPPVVPPPTSPIAEIIREIIDSITRLLPIALVGFVIIVGIYGIAKVIGVIAATTHTLSERVIERSVDGYLNAVRNEALRNQSIDKDSLRELTSSQAQAEVSKYLRKRSSSIQAAIDSGVLSESDVIQSFDKIGAQIVNMATPPITFLLIAKVIAYLCAEGQLPGKLCES
jgi:hypothetical protein